MQLEGKSLRSDYARFVTATVASLTVFSLYSMADGLFVAWGVNEIALSAVNLAVPYMNALFSIAVLFAVGTSTVIAIYLGQGEGQRANSLLSQNVVLLLVIGVSITGLTFGFLEPFSRLLGANDQTLSYVKEYLSGLAPFSACFIISYNLEILVKTDGRPRLAIISVISGCVANCVMDYIAIFILDWGVTGAAVATGLSQLLTCVIYTAHFFGKKTTFHLTKFHFDWKIYKRIIPIGFSDGVTELCNGVMIFLFNRTILRYLGQNGIVSYTIIAYVNTVVINLMVGVSQGSQPLVSYHYGKQETGVCRKLLRYGVITVGVAAVVSFAGLFLFAPQLVELYLGSKNPALNAQSVMAFRQYSLSYLVLGFNVVIGGYLTAIERPKPAIAISMGRGLVVQSICLLSLAAMVGGSAIWFTPLLSETLVLGLSVFFLLRHKKESIPADIL